MFLLFSLFAVFFFFNDTATTEIYTLSLHDALPIWLLGSSDYSAQLAAQVGAGFSFAYHFSDFPPEIPMLAYRNQFTPSAWRQTPYAILGVAAICADTEA